MRETALSENYDLVLAGGHVIDPANDLNGPADVAVANGTIAAVSPGLSTAGAAKVVNVSGLYVTPGLIDIHSHHFGYSGWTFPDEYAFPNGTTTVVDAGGAGYKNFEQFKTEIIDRARVRLLALLNIVGGGMLGAIEQDVSEMQPEPCADRIAEYPDILVGIKAAHHKYGWESVDGAVAAGDMCGKFVMVDFQPRPERTYRELILERMRPGDVHTHMYGQHIEQLDAGKKVQDYMWEAREKGILFDVGHGGGSFWFRVVGPCMEQGWRPDTISTDAHKGSLFLPRATMPITMSKLVSFGMSFEEAVRRSTIEPAKVINRPELGSLSAGAEADIAVLELEEGDFGFVDSGLAAMRGNRRLTAHLTVRAGEIVWDLNGISRPDWTTQGDYVRIDN
ncbi:MAG: amidohydrolase/deacetylase family metallohydrolase [Chloroflexi bacterium]|nr:amidohydrolase/deacetylase family metallohydrolase [Chloroflexota bacterium]